MDSGEEVSDRFLVARGDGSELLERIEESLDEIALGVEGEVASALGRAVGLGRDRSRLSRAARRRSGLPFRVSRIGLAVSVM